MPTKQAEPQTELVSDEELWYDEAFAPGQTPSFEAFVRAHIERTTELDDAPLDEIPREEVTCIRLPDNLALLYHVDYDKVGKDLHVYCFISYLYDNHACAGKPKAASFTFIMQALSGKEKDIFKLMDKTRYNEVAAGMFELLCQYPATTCRMFGMGLVGYTVSAVNSSDTPAYKARLNNVMRDYVLPWHHAKPFVMLHDVIAPGYHYPMDYMLEDYRRLSLQDQAKAYIMMDERAQDEEAYHTWLRTKMKACPVTNTDVALAILDENRYSEDVLFTFDAGKGNMIPARQEPRAEPLELSVYQSLRYKQITANDPVGDPTPPSSEEPDNPQQDEE